MTVQRMRVSLVAVWVATLTVIVATRVALGAPITSSAAIEIVLLAGIPAAILFVVFRGAGPRNTTQMLYDIDHVASAGPPKSETVKRQ